MRMYVYAAVYALHRPVSLFGRVLFWTPDGSVANHIESDQVLTPSTLDNLNSAVHLPHRRSILTSVTFLGMVER